MSRPPALQTYLDLRAAIIRKRLGDGGRDVCSALTSALDAALAELADGLPARACVVALGGYGRGEQCIRSDVDVMVLYETDDPEPLVRQVLYPLWDADLKVGHAVRTIGENREHASTDFESLTSLLSGRLIGGDPALFEAFEEMLIELVRKRPLASALVAAERERRRVDPYPSMTTNVKTGRGGLRTHHGFWWERRRAELLGIPADKPGSDEAQARAALLRIRNALHAVAGRAEDRFLVDLREPAAQWLGSDVTSVAADYTAAMNVGDRLADQRWPDLHAEQDPMVGFGRRIFSAVRSRFAPPEPERDDRILALAVEAAARPDGAWFTPDEEQLIAAAETAPWTAADRADFVKLLAAGARGRTIFGRLRALGWVDREFPEWSVVATAPQLAPFHDHPVGTHLWRAVDEMVELIGAPGDTGEIAAELGSTEELLLAAFLHDIGKARGGNHSAVGAEVAVAFLRRVGFGPATVSVVGNVIRHHLLLSETATRRDVASLDVINDVADRIGDSRRLDILYLLTIADLRATGTDMWTEWRAALIRRLYRRVGEALAAGGARPATPDVDAILAAGGSDRREVEEHVAAMPDIYLAGTSPGEVLWHMEAARQLVGGAAISVDPDDPGRVLVVGADRAGFLLAVTRAFTANGVGILEARLLTRDDGLALDTFYVARDQTGGVVSAARWEAIGADLEGALTGERDLRPAIRERVAAYRPTGSGRPLVRTGIEGRYTIVEVRAADRIGLLADIVAALHGDGLDIHLARIDTMGGEARDVFHVRRAGGVPIRDESELAALRSRITDALGG